MGFPRNVRGTSAEMLVGASADAVRTTNKPTVPTNQQGYVTFANAKAALPPELGTFEDNAVTGCWEWTGFVFPNADGHGGYGGVWVVEGVKGRAAHRAVYEILVGPIPPKLVLDHLCRVRRCVNPAHLEAVIHGENIRRGKVFEQRKHRPFSEPQLAAITWKAHSPHPSEAGMAAARFKAYVREFESDLLLNVLSEYAAGGWHAQAFTQQVVRDRIGKFRELRRDEEKNSETRLARGLRSIAAILSAGLPVAPQGEIREAHLSKSTSRPGGLADA